MEEKVLEARLNFVFDELAMKFNRVSEIRFPIWLFCLHRFPKRELLEIYFFYFIFFEVGA